MYIPKADGRQRPLGIASLEDKIVQRAVVEVLNAVYEVDFRGFSYGFRPGRGPHDALDALAVGIERKRVNWVLDADIRDFFGQLDHSWLERFLEHRIADKRVLRLIGKWLAAGVIEDGKWSESVEGCTAGGIGVAVARQRVPALRLRPVGRLVEAPAARGDVDHRAVRRRLHRRVSSIEEDAQRFLAELRERFAKFGLELHPDKTRLIEFGRHAARRPGGAGSGQAGDVRLPGLHAHLREVQERAVLARRITISKRMRAKLREVNDQLKRRRHQPIPVQGQWLRSVVQGHLAYYAVPGNTDAVAAFRYQVTRHWYQALRRRSQRTRHTWMQQYAN